MRELGLKLIKDLGIHSRSYNRKYRIGLFKCPLCGSEVEKIMKDGVKAKVCSRSCYAKIRERRGPYKSGTVLISGYYYDYLPEHPFSTKKGYVAQHRIQAENKIGRMLLPNEDVHHINEIKTDNRQENLMVMSKSEHSKLHRKKTKRDSNGKFKI